jgi:hypothetical protein
MQEHKQSTIIDKNFELSLGNPTPIISYSQTNKVIDKMTFCHLGQYYKSNTEVEMA